MIDVDHPLRDLIERHWPIPPTTDAAAADIRRRAIDDLIEDLDEVTHFNLDCRGDW